MVECYTKKISPEKSRMSGLNIFFENIFKFIIKKMSVYLGGADMAMAECFGNQQEIFLAAAVKMGGKGMAQGMHGHMLFDPSLGYPLPKSSLHLTAGDPIASVGDKKRRTICDDVLAFFQPFSQKPAQSGIDEPGFAPSAFDHDIDFFLIQPYMVNVEVDQFGQSYSGSEKNLYHDQVSLGGIAFLPADSFHQQFSFIDSKVNRLFALSPLDTQSPGRIFIHNIVIHQKIAKRSQGQAYRLSHLQALRNNINRIAAELEEGLSVIAPNQAEQAFSLGIKDGVREMKYLKIPDYTSLKAGEVNALVDAIFTTIDREALDFFIRYRMQLAGGVAEQLQYEIKTRITAGILSGKSTPGMVREIGKVIDKPEEFKKTGKTVFKSTQQRLRLIYRTEVNRAHNGGRVAFYKEIGIKKVQWWAALDRRTCQECASRHGQVYDVDGLDLPPQHSRCRCCLMSYLGNQIAM